MKKLILVCCLALLSISSIWADDLEMLQGKWSVKKTGDQGAYTQRLEFKKNKWTFKIVGDNDTVVFYAEGDAELKKQGPFSTIRLFNIKGGQSETDLQSVDDERVSVYVVEAGSFTLASNFDKQRGNEKPGMDTYTKSN